MYPPLSHTSPSLFSLFAQRVFHNPFAINSFRTLSKKCRVYGVRFHRFLKLYFNFPANSPRIIRQPPNFSSFAFTQLQTLSFSVSRNSCICLPAVAGHSYENHRGCIPTLPILKLVPPTSPNLPRWRISTFKCAFCIPDESAGPTNLQTFMLAGDGRSHLLFLVRGRMAGQRAKTEVERPPRGVNSPRTTHHSGSIASTMSRSILLTAFS